MRLPGPVPGGPAVSVVWSAPRRDVIEARSGRTRLGWRSTVYACALGRPDLPVGEAQAPDRVLLRLVQACGVLILTVEFLLYRLGWDRDDDEQDQS